MYKRYPPYTSKLFVNHRYDGLMTVIAGIVSFSVISLFIAWCLCLI